MFKRAYFLTSLVLLAFSFVVIWSSMSFEYWNNNQPGPGFFPLWLGIVLAILSVVLLIQSFNPQKGGKFEVPDKQGLRNLIMIVLSQVGVLVLMPLIGFRISSALFLFVLFSAFPRYGRIMNLVISILLSLGFFALFKTWLQVPLPIGLFGF